TLIVYVSSYNRSSFRFSFFCKRYGKGLPIRASPFASRPQEPGKSTCHAGSGAGARWSVAPAGAFLTWRAPALWAAWTFVGWQDTRALPFPGAPDRVCDTVAEFEHAAARGRRSLVDVELQARPDADMLERLGEYAFMLRRERRHGPGEE